MSCTIAKRGQASEAASGQIPHLHPNADYIFNRMVAQLESGGVQISQARSLRSLCTRLAELGMNPKFMDRFKGLATTGQWRLLILKRRMLAPNCTLYVVFGFDNQPLDENDDVSEVWCDFLVGYVA